MDEDNWVVRLDFFMKGVNFIYGVCDFMVFLWKMKLKMVVKGVRFVYVMYVWFNVRVFF